MRCKIIISGKNTIEDNVNNWLSSGKYEIVNILQSQDELYITITIFYLEKNEIREKKLKQLNKQLNNDTEN